MKRHIRNNRFSGWRWLCVLAAICFPAVLTANAATPWRFSRTYIYKKWDFAQIEYEKVDLNGGTVDLVVSGKAANICGNGSEKIRVTWRFDKDISQFNPGDTFGAKLEARMTNASGDCNGGLSYRIFALVARGIFSISWDDIVGKRMDGDRFENVRGDRANPDGNGPNAVETVLKFNTHEPYPDRQVGGFIVYIGGVGGEMAYLYAYEPVRGGDFPSLGGKWYREGNISRPASIRQSGGTLTFTNENGNSSRGHFESSDVVVADDWLGGLRGRLNADRTQINWANGSIWSRGVNASYPNIDGTWYREGNRSLPAYVNQSEGALSFTNEYGNTSRGRFESYYVVVADSWQGGLRGRLNQSFTRIDWDNGTSWQR